MKIKNFNKFLMIGASCALVLGFVTQNNLTNNQIDSSTNMSTLTQVDTDDYTPLYDDNDKELFYDLFKETAQNSNSINNSNITVSQLNFPVETIKPVGTIKFDKGEMFVVDYQDKDDSLTPAKLDFPEEVIEPIIIKSEDKNTTITDKINVIRKKAKKSDNPKLKI